MTGWAGTDADLEVLAAGLDRLMTQPMSHANLRAFVRTLERLPVDDLGHRVADAPVRDDILASVEDGVDFLRDATDASSDVHLNALISRATRQLDELHRAVSGKVRAGVQTTMRGRTLPGVGPVAPLDGPGTLCCRRPSRHPGAAGTRR